MKEQDFADWNAEAEAALRAHRNPAGAPSDVSARIRARLLADIAAMPTSPAENPSSPTDAARTSARGVRRALGRAGQILASFVAGAVAGASAHAWLASRNPARPPIAIENPTPRELLAPLPPIDRAPPMEPPRAFPPAVIESAPATSASDLNAERALLDQAQRALSRGDAAAALTPLNTHARRFARGRLEEEREALAVKTLVALGRNDDARARGARFLARFPESIMLPSVDDALRTIR
jgi:hypothetical protein